MSEKKIVYAYESDKSKFLPLLAHKHEEGWLIKEPVQSLSTGLDWSEIDSFMIGFSAGFTVNENKGD